MVPPVQRSGKPVKVTVDDSAKSGMQLGCNYARLHLIKGPFRSKEKPYEGNKDNVYLQRRDCTLEYNSPDIFELKTTGIVDKNEIGNLFCTATITTHYDLVRKQKLLE
jgi:hypothetical protein